MNKDVYAEPFEVFEKKFKTLVSLIESSSCMTVFTGAGVSTLSGIPDFRGAHGVYTDPWHGMDVEEIISLSFFRREPKIFYQWAKDVWYHLEDYKPNIVHNSIALLEKKGHLKTVYTQNIDMLHQKAGSTDVVEIHGSPEYHYCTKCGKSYTYNEIAPFVRSNVLPVCTCGGIIKPKIVFYEENLVEKDLDRAFMDFSKTDLCLVLGSSLVVQPAASLPVLALRNNAKVVIVNAQPTTLDKYCTLCFSSLQQTFDSLYSYLLNK